MMTGNMSEWTSVFSYLPECFLRGVKYSLQADMLSAEPGKYEVEGSAIYINVNEGTTEDVKARRFEAHKEYADIQIVLSGRELHLYEAKQVQSKPLEDRLATHDIAFYPAPAEYNKLFLAEGDFAVYFPGELHCPMCFYSDTAEKVRKMIVKVHRSLWEKK